MASFPQSPIVGRTVAFGNFDATQSENSGHSKPQMSNMPYPELARLLATNLDWEKHLRLSFTLTKSRQEKCWSYALRVFDISGSDELPNGPGPGGSTEKSQKSTSSSTEAREAAPTLPIAMDASGQSVLTIWLEQRGFQDRSRLESMTYLFSTRLTTLKRTRASELGPFSVGELRREALYRLLREPRGLWRLLGHPSLTARERLTRLLVVYVLTRSTGCLKRTFATVSTLALLERLKMESGLSTNGRAVTQNYRTGSAATL